MNTQQSLQKAPELSVSKWFNTIESITLEKLRGKVVVIESFQMLCPGCVSHGLPQAQQIAALFPKNKVVVIGLHTVFEHHSAMTPVSLEAFIHEYQLNFPIGVDEEGIKDIPKTMEAYKLRGTPSMVIIDQDGYLRASHYGHVSDMRIASEITQLICHGSTFNGSSKQNKITSGCDESGCTI